MTRALVHHGGLAPHLAASLAGEDMRARAAQALQKLQQPQADAGDWRDAAFALACLGETALASQLLQQALAQSRSYVLPCAQQPPRLRLLMLLVAGDLAANAPLDCLLVGSGIAITQTYVDETPFSYADLPEHDVLFVAVAHAPEHRSLLQHLQRQLSDWPRPLLDQPQALLGLDRVDVARQLQGLPGLWAPATQSYTREQLATAALSWPCIIRPAGSQAGQGLARLDAAPELQDYLQGQTASTYTLAPFVDYRRPDGLYAKMRLALIDGVAWPCHYALSEHWMVHYVNAGMYEDAAKRAAEASFMAGFAAWVQPHAALLAEISRRLNLSYVLLDAAELADGRLLLFEADHAMVVHAMDDAQKFPYKQLYMARVRDAMVACLLRHAGVGA